ncbi:MAG TPA: SDR family oxidoreductase [Saprospiraceae bacterium]|jgi:L-fucose dehydrogenase|nr:MAG: short-chain dehydrogenase [Candidatus Parvibacillus calidus]MBX2937679.1 SDR family oxidoreductase [Saprospiraceae bacterium]MBK7740173.1 SDR family oxidoreductase [Candidatus Parvibacillus calidus]MBX7178493.1 SDR family oxidoreductase [Saprospiraceae bacterium]MCB0590252.1 SDR family oxidoreductase [Saprospiraceae bacterium]
MDLQLRDKVMLITGGAMGIGGAICKALVREGAIPVIIDKNAEAGERLKSEIEDADGSCLFIPGELADPEACRKAVATAAAQFGHIDGLVNNAGVNDGVGLEHGDYHRFIQSLHNNLIHYYMMAHYCLPYLKSTCGSIVNITSKTSVTGQGGTSAYAAANGARNALTREWAVELLKYNIRVNAIVVSECWTPQYERWIQTLPDAAATLAMIHSRIPLQNRMTTPEEIADTAIFLLSGRSGHTTGQLVYVDGGYVHLDRALIKK